MFNYRRGFMAQRHVKPLNPALAEGIVTSHLKGIEAFYGLILNCAFNGDGSKDGERPVPGFEYVGMERCTPEEQFRHSTKKIRNKRISDLSRSTVFMIRITFRWQGEPIIRYLYLPYAKAAGETTLNGSSFIIHPVLDNPDISATHDSIFVRLYRSKVNVKSRQGAFVLDGEYNACRILTSNLHNKASANTSDRYSVLRQARPTLAHYLFSKKGVMGAFKEYAKADVMVVSEKDLGFLVKKNGDPLYPTTEWIHCSPLARSSDPDFPTPILLVRRSQWNTIAESLVGGFYYVYGFFMDRVQAEHITADQYEIDLWRVLLGHITFKSDAAESKILSDINEHMGSLDFYLDTATKADLARSDVEVRDLYELLAYIMDNFFRLTTESNDNSMAGKRLNTLRYVCERLIASTFHCLFNIKSVMNKPRVNADAIRRIFNKQLSHDLIFRLNSDGVIVQSASTSVDNMAFNITNHIVPQNETVVRTKGSKISNNDPTLRLDASIAEFGSLVHLPKNSPTGRNRINLWSKINRNSELEPDPSKAALIQDLADKISR